jgi:hypothetical protein
MTDTGIKIGPTKEIIVSARDRIVVKTDDFGTVYRITLLNDNQQLAGGFSVEVNSGPGINQGYGRRGLLLSKISGDDKCKYAVFRLMKWP